MNIDWLLWKDHSSSGIHVWGGGGGISFEMITSVTPHSLCIDFLPFSLSAVPTPTVIITSTPVSPIHPIGSTVTLTCTVDLSPLVDVPVTVTAQISAPMGVAITPVTNSVMENATRYTSTSRVGPFGREQSGEYTCMANVGLATANPLIISGTGVTGMDMITIGTGKFESTIVCSTCIMHTNLFLCAGIYLSLKGMVYANNSAIQITEIGETNTISNTGLQCITDRMPCCAAAGARAGEWNFPNGTTVPTQGVATTFYRTRGDDGTVNLNRLNTNVMMPTGLFCCEVPDTSGDTQPLCANIGA